MLIINYNVMFLMYSFYNIRKQKKLYCLVSVLVFHEFQTKPNRREFLLNFDECLRIHYSLNFCTVLELFYRSNKYLFEQKSSTVREKFLIQSWTITVQLKNRYE